MASIRTIYSGSSGNCTLVAGDGGVLLVDMGKSCKQTLTLLYELGYAASDVKGILVTHEHSDHIGGLKIFLKHYEVPVFGMRRVLNELTFRDYVPLTAEMTELEHGVTQSICGLDVTPFRTPHDSVDCCGYRFESGTGAVALATDLGTVSDETYSFLSGSKGVILESNYDRGLLMTGPYPFPLKQRIMSAYGHLDNLDSSETVRRLVSEGTKEIVLAHLSDKNNTPSIARTTCEGILDNYGLNASVETASRYKPGREIQF